MRRRADGSELGWRIPAAAERRILRRGLFRGQKRVQDGTPKSAGETPTLPEIAIATGQRLPKESDNSKACPMLLQSVDFH